MNDNEASLKVWELTFLELLKDSNIKDIKYSMLPNTFWYVPKHWQISVHGQL